MDQLVRLPKGAMLGGVCGGLAEYFRMDATLVIVPELNQGQMRLEVERVNQGRARSVGIEQVDGEMMAPERILGEIRGSAKG